LQRDASFLLFFVNIVVQKFNNQVDVSQNHAAAAVALAAKLVESFGSRDALLVDQVEVAVPFVATNLQTELACVQILPCHM
jgi:hypothetical protein